MVPWGIVYNLCDHEIIYKTLTFSVIIYSSIIASMWDKIEVKEISKEGLNVLSTASYF